MYFRVTRPEIGELQRGYSVTDLGPWLMTALTTRYMTPAPGLAKGNDDASNLCTKTFPLGFAYPDRGTGSGRRAASRRATDCFALHGACCQSRRRRARDFRHPRASR